MKLAVKRKWTKKEALPEMKSGGYIQNQSKIPGFYVSLTHKQR